MTYFPKEQSNPITNMVAELNHLLKGQYFTVVITESVNEVKYNLNLTQFGLKSKKYLYIATHDGFGLNYKQMVSYMQGILVGFRAGVENK